MHLSSSPQRNLRLAQILPRRTALSQPLSRSSPPDPRSSFAIPLDCRLDFLDRALDFVVGQVALRAFTVGQGQRPVDFGLEFAQAERFVIVVVGSSVSA
jgi:hypothetical protein